MSANPVSTMGSAVGIDGYRRGWVAARLDDERITWSSATVPDIAALLPAGIVVGIDMPIGLLATGERLCDSLARRELPGAASRVFTTPPRAVLELGPAAPNAEVQVLCRRLTGKGVSRQAINLAPRILALDEHLARNPDHLVAEVHPEISFTELAGRVLTSKKSAAGVGQRIAALESWLPATADALAAVPSDVPIDDALDALAALWSAVRLRDGQARSLPRDAERSPRIVV
jgi:predicted RNase H-like nuclease